MYLKDNVPKKNPIAIHSGSNCGYNLHVLEKTRKKNYLFSSKEKKVTRIDKNGEKVTKNISYILQFIDSARFMASLLSILVNNLYEGIHRIKYKYGQDDKKCETCI